MRKCKFSYELLAAFLCVCFIIYFIGNKTTAAQNDRMDLNTLANAIEEYDGTIIGWSLYARETITFSSTDEWINKADQLQGAYPDWTWNISVDSGIIVGEKQNGHFSESIEVLPINHEIIQQSYITYEAKGDGWRTNKNSILLEKANQRIQQLFTDQRTIFSCIKGEFNESFDDFTGKTLSNLVKDYQAEQIEHVKEQEFHSISAYSSLFAQTLSFTNRQMNMQIGLRKKEIGSGTMIVVGTPILTIEY